MQLVWDNAPTEDARSSLPNDLVCPPDEVVQKTIVLFHNETTFQWGTKDDYMLVPKSKRNGIMVSDFISEKDGFLGLTEEEFQVDQQTKPNITQYGDGLQINSWNRSRNV